MSRLIKKALSRAVASPAKPTRRQARRLRRRIGVAGFVLCALLAAGGAAQAAKNVAFINPGFEDKGFWKAVSDTMREAAGQFGFDLEILSADREWPRMIENANSVFARDKKPDYLILVNEHQQAPDLLRRAEELGIPTILLLNSLTEEQAASYGQARRELTRWIGSLTPDNRIAGYEIGQSIFQAATQAGLADDGSISTLVLAGDFKTPASLQRLEGLDDILKGFPKATVERRLTVNWSFDLAYKRTSVWLKSGPLDAVWAANDPIALGAIQALREAGQTPGRDVMVAGLNWSPEALDLVRRGELQLTHGGHFLAGAWIMVLLHDYDQGNDFGSEATHLRFPMTAIDSANVERYIANLGNSDWSRIDFSRFSKSENSNLETYDFSIEALLAAVRN